MLNGSAQDQQEDQTTTAPRDLNRLEFVIGKPCDFRNTGRSLERSDSGPRMNFICGSEEFLDFENVITKAGKAESVSCACELERGNSKASLCVSDRIDADDRIKGGLLDMFGEVTERNSSLLPVLQEALFGIDQGAFTSIFSRPVGIFTGVLHA
jgi:hypothetical protein